MSHQPISDDITELVSSLKDLGKDVSLEILTALLPILKKTVAKATEIVEARHQ